MWGVRSLGTAVLPAASRKTNGPETSTGIATEDTLNVLDAACTILARLASCSLRWSALPKRKRYQPHLVLMYPIAMSPQCASSKGH